MDFGTFFGTPFAESGDKVAIPVESQPSNAVSFTSGYTQDYALNITTDPRAKSIGRTGQNYLFWAITAALGGLQRFGAPSWVGPDDNGGVPLAYPKGARVQEGLVFYVSLIDNNTRALTDTTAWGSATYSPASNAEALAGTARDLLVTPATLAHVLANTSIGQQATTTQAGVTRYATAAETQGGAVATAAVTPAGLKPALDAKASTTAPAFIGPVTVQPASGSTAAVEVRRRMTGDVPGLRAYGYNLQPDNSFALLAYDATGANPYSAITIGAYAATPAESVFSTAGDVSAGRNLVAGGRVQAATLASETVSSTTRLATASEMTAAAATVSVSPARVAEWANGRFLTASNPKALGTLSIPGSDDGSLYYNPVGNLTLFSTSAAAGPDSNLFAFRCWNTAGSAVDRTAYTINRTTGEATFNYDVRVTGRLIAPFPTTEISSTIRLATQAEVNAGTLTDGAVAPSTLAARLGSYLPLAGGRMTGELSVSARDGGFRWRTAAGILQAFTNVEYTAAKLFAFATCDDTGAFRQLAYTINRLNAEFRFGGIAIGPGAQMTYLRSTSRRDKKNIHRDLGFAEAAARINAYHSVIGSWKPETDGEHTDTRPRPFFLADEVHAHAPELVSLDDDGVPGAVGYSDEMPSVMVVLQQLMRTVEAQGKEIEQLRARLR